MVEKGLVAKVMNFFVGGGRHEDPLYEETAKDSFSAESSSTLIQSLVGTVSAVGDYHFPADIIGGCCPRVVGSEQEIVWNAAAEAADTERIHIVWQAQGDKIWYLVVRSSDMGSHPNTWCPFASCLPGMKDSSEPPVIYTYFSDESATMMTVLKDGLQIHRGTSSVVRAKAERMSRELGDAPVIEMIPDRIEKLSPIPWFSLSLFEERSRRVLAALAVFSAMIVLSLAIVVWFFATMSAMRSNTNLHEIQERSEQKSVQLLHAVQAQRASPMREQLAKFADINDGLLSLNGYLDIYLITGNKVLWRAIVPENVTSNRINDLGGQTLESGGEFGVVIGNSPESLSAGQVKKGR
ncbi:MAG: hypothetical protein WC612_07850 [Bdellovibrionales bacterium]|jgi:hypothetical protein